MLSQCQMSAENVNMMCLLTDAGIRNLIGIFEEGTVISRKQLFSSLDGFLVNNLIHHPFFRTRNIFFNTNENESNITQTRSSMTRKKFSFR